MGGFRVGVMWDSDWNSVPHRHPSRLQSQGDVLRRSSMSDLAQAGIHGFEKVGHYAHLLPRWTMSLLAVITGVVMAAIAWAMTQCDVILVFKKFQVAQSMLTDVHWMSALLFLWVTSAIMASLSAALIIYIHPPGAGSGLPELKGYANGNRIDNLYGQCGNWVRGVGAVLATGAGLCTGREGPVVSLGGSVGVALTRILTLPFYKVWVDLDVAEHDQESMELDLRSYARCKRLGCMMGGAAGLTAVFNAPLGATLYMLEEVTISAWSTQTTFHVLGAAIVSKLVMRLLLSINGEEVHSIIVYDNHQDRHSTYDWGPIDVPFFALVGLIGGTLGALYSRGSILVWKLRNKSRFCRRRQGSKRVKMSEVIVIAIFSITVMFLAPLLVRCSHALLGELEERVFVRHFCNCDKEIEELRVAAMMLPLDANFTTSTLASQFCGLTEGAKVAIEGPNVTESGEPESLAYVDFNVAATYLLQGTEGAIKQLYSRDYHVGEEFWALLLTLGVYSVFALMVAGLPMPTGTFIPNMFMGAVVGRMTPLIVTAIFHDGMKWLADPGVYAVVGSAAMLSGFTHMTIAICALLVEVTLDLYLSGPILIGCLFGRFVSRAIQHYDFNEALILLKGVPYLEAECPIKVHESHMTAGECADVIPPVALLSLEAERKMIHMALTVRPKVPYFPLLDSERRFCVGLIPRSRLEVIMSGDGLQGELVAEDEEEKEPEIDDDDKIYRHPLFEEDLELEIGQGPEYERDPVPLFGLSTPVSHSITEDTLIAHAWPLLARMALDKVCVLAQHLGDGGGSQPMSALPSVSSLIGILERRHLVRLAEEHYH